MPPIEVTYKNTLDTGSEKSLERGRMKREIYWAKTRDHLRAMDLPGVPRLGDAIGLDYPSLVVTNISARPLGGIDDSNGTGGVSEIAVLYTERSEQLSVLSKEVQPPGVKHTVLTPSNESVDIGIDVDDEGNPKYNRSGPETFNGGKPASKLVGRITAEVYDFRPESYDVPYPSLIALQSDKALNKTAIELPAPIGTTKPISVGAKQALYMAFRVEKRPDSILIVHELALANDFDHRWSVVDADGKVKSQGRGQLYRAADFGGLWA
ncbi:MAG: hypothetical protein JSS51_01365 [Planctomycetes bacterium]|nr:hypothetical protein [Planctomycetota bacterium]